MTAQIRVSDPAFADAMRLEQSLIDGGFKVECMLSSKMANFFDGQKGAALFRTTSGDFEVLFLPERERFDSLNIREERINGRYLYSFQGKPQFERSIDSSGPRYFVKRSNTLFMLSSSQLAAKLKALS